MDSRKRLLIFILLNLFLVCDVFMIISMSEYKALVSAKMIETRISEDNIGKIYEIKYEYNYKGKVKGYKKEFRYVDKSDIPETVYLKIAKTNIAYLDGDIIPYLIVSIVCIVFMLYYTFPFKYYSTPY